MIEDSNVLREHQHPIAGLDDIPIEMYCEAIYDDATGFRVFLKGEDPAGQFLKVSFDAELAFRKIDEGDCLQRASEFCPLRRSLIYESEDSEFLLWYHVQSVGIRQNQGIKSYLIATLNDWVEVVAFEPPKVEWTKEIS